MSWLLAVLLVVVVVGVGLFVSSVAVAVGHYRNSKLNYDYIGHYVHRLTKGWREVKITL